MIKNEKVYKDVCNSLKKDCKSYGYSILGELLAADSENYLQDSEMITAVTQNLANNGYLEIQSGLTFKSTNKGYDFFIKYDENSEIKPDNLIILP